MSQGAWGQGAMDPGSKEPAREPKSQPSSESRGREPTRSQGASNQPGSQQ